MDRYVFRGKRLDNGEWVYGAIFNGNFSCLIFPEIRHTDSSDLYRVFAHEVDPDTIGQCTGIKDKNGNLIYEGDAVTFPHVLSINYIIAFDDGAFVFKASNGRTVKLSGIFAQFCEIIGNIHD